MIAAFTRFDLRSWVPRTQTLLPLAAIVVAGIVLPVPGMAIVAAAFIASLTVSTPFLGDERGQLDTLYGVMPVSRRTVVVGRALAVLAFTLAAFALALVVTLAVAATRGSMPAAEILILAFAVAFAFVGLSMSIQLPVLFRLGYTRGRLIAYAPALAVAAVAWLAQATGALDGASPLLEGVPVAVVAAGGALVGVVGIVVGVLAAAPIYARRQM
ncbi:ABC-2 transporter permease [Agrococcus sp. 1P02AA]|uniref:ABC-2 transporter permease n=1 Tax=Agrococcus sp. 1P02AA TaxID=3132259 RepID=UPI0039A65584